MRSFWERQSAMQIYLAKNDQKFGPYTPVEVRARVASGEFSDLDRAWHEKLTEWVSVRQLLSNLPVEDDERDEVQRPISVAAVLSFLLAVGGVVGWLALFVIAAVMAGQNGMTKASPNDPIFGILGLAVLGLIAGNIVGAVLGLVVLGKDIRNKWMAVVGMILNAAEFIGIAFLMALGVVMRV